MKRTAKKVSKKDLSANLRKSKKGFYITIIIILLVLLLGISIIAWPKDSGSEAELAKCIGEHSTLYVQYGCPHCKTQEEIFGDDIKYLKMIDCYYEREKCSEIMATPTWIVNGKQILGVQSLGKLKELTGC